MSASNIADAIVTNLATASVFGGASGAGTHYRILETTACYAGVVSWTGLREVEETFSSDEVEAFWTHTVEIYVKDTGDPVAVNNRIQEGIDLALASIRADKTLQGTVERISEIRASRELPDAGLFEAAGFAWHRALMEIDSIEWPNG